VLIVFRMMLFVFKVGWVVLMSSVGMVMHVMDTSVLMDGADPAVLRDDISGHIFATMTMAAMVPVCMVLAGALFVLIFIFMIIFVIALKLVHMRLMHCSMIEIHLKGLLNGMAKLNVLSMCVVWLHFEYKMAACRKCILRVER